MDKPVRLSALDGLRGWAALVVAAFHFFWGMLGDRFPEIHSVPVAMLLDAPLAVATFLCITGVVLTHGSWRGPKVLAYGILLRRYGRLMLPILASTLIVFLVLILGLNANQEAAVALQSPWLGGFLQIEPHLGEFLLWATVLVFMGRDMSPNPFLWPMYFELWWSLLVLGICLFERQVRRPYSILAIVTVVCLFFSDTTAFGAAIPVGALIALAHRDGRLPTLSARIALPVLAGTLLIGGLLQVHAPNPALTAVLGSVVVLLAICCPVVGRFLKMPFSQWLGRISFAIYLVHFAVMVTVSSHLVVLADGAGLLNLPTSLAISAISLVSSMAAAVLFMPVERFTLWANRRILGAWPRLRPAAATSI